MIKKVRLNLKEIINEYDMVDLQNYINCENIWDLYCALKTNKQKKKLYEILKEKDIDTLNYDENTKKEKNLFKKFLNEKNEDVDEIIIELYEFNYSYLAHIKLIYDNVLFQNIENDIITREKIIQIEKNDNKIFITILISFMLYIIIMSYLI